MRPVLLASVLLFSPFLTGQTFVDASANAGGDGKSWTTAYNNLQTALSKAGNGSVLWVAKGTYAGGFKVPANVQLYGGFASGATRITQRDPMGMRSVLDGNSSQRVVELAQSSVIDGFVVTRGKAGGDGGGGALINGISATIRNCLFQDNENTGGRASALHVMNKGNVRLENTVFYKNKGFGHVIDFTGANGVVNNIVIYDNTSNGLHFFNGSAVRIYNSIFANNTGRGICHISSNDAPVVENNLFWGNRVSHFHYRGRELRTIGDINKLSYAKNNLTGDPMLVDPANGDFRVKPGSIAIDKGVNTIPSGMSNRDLYGNSRLLDSDLNGSMVADMGAAEYANATIDVTGTAQAGKRITLKFRGKTGLGAVLIIGDRPASFLVAPFGYLFVDITGAFALLPWVNNKDVLLTIPSGTGKGTTFVFQGLAVDASGMNLTNLEDVLVK